MPARPAGVLRNASTTRIEFASALVVDDEAFALRRITRALAQIARPGIVIVATGNHAAALAATAQAGGAFDLVLLNYMLWPDERTGIELLADLRGAGLSPAAKAVLYSLSMTAALRRRALATGFREAFLSEDIDAQVLRDVLLRASAA